MRKDFLSATQQPASQAQSALSDKNLRRPFIRLAAFEDYDQIAAVEGRNKLTVKSRDQWLDLWLDNPAYLELGDWPIGWVIEDGNGNIVGCLGNVPSFCYFEGRRYVTAAGRGWAVDAPYRALSIMLLAHQLKQPGADMNVVTTPSPATATLCTQLGWSRVPVGEWDRSAFWITNYTKAVRGYLAAKAPGFVSSVLGAVISPPLLLKDAISSRFYGLKNDDYQLEWCAGFDSRFDGFWDDIKEQNPDLLLSVRNSETLASHFKHALRQNRTWILTASEGSRLVAYAILERRDTRSLDLTRALFVDLQMLSKDSNLGSAMIRFALNRCRAEGIHVLENAGCWIETLQPIHPSPYRRDLETWCYLYRVTNPDLEEPLRHAAAWYPTQYDGDASL